MRIIVVALFLILGYVVLYASAVSFSKDRVTQELIAYARDGDAEGLKSRIDFRVMRFFVKKDLKKKSKAVRGGSVAIPIGPEPDKISEIVDFYVQPERIDLLLALKPEIFPDTDPADFVWDVSYAGPFAFRITVGYPTGKDEQTLFSERMSTISFVFKAHGWKWRAKEMHVPLFMLPKELYDDDEIEQFLSHTFP